MVNSCSTANLSRKPDAEFMSKCPFCGSDNRALPVFCPHCGYCNYIGAMFYWTVAKTAIGSGSGGLRLTTACGLVPPQQ